MWCQCVAVNTFFFTINTVIYASARRVSKPFCWEKHSWRWRGSKSEWRHKIFEIETFGSSDRKSLKLRLWQFWHKIFEIKTFQRMAAFCNTYFFNAFHQHWVDTCSSQSILPQPIPMKLGPEFSHPFCSLNQVLSRLRHMLMKRWQGHSVLRALVFSMCFVVLSVRPISCYSQWFENLNPLS